MEKVNRVLGVVIAIILILISSISSLAHSKYEGIMDDSVASEILYCIRGQDVPEKLVEELEDISIHVSTSSLLKVVRMQVRVRMADDTVTSIPGATVLMVTNENGLNTTTDILFAANSNGSFVSVLPEDGDLSTPRLGGTSYLPSYGNALVHATAVFNKVYESSDPYHFFPYYQPVGMYFIYYANGTDSLTYADICYQTEGFEYTYPGFVDVSGGVTYTHEISRIVSNPASNTIYHKVDSYRSDRALHISSGSPFVGQFFNYGLTINGNYIDGTVRIFDND